MTAEHGTEEPPRHLVFDVSTMLAWAHRRPHGITRVQMEVAEVLVRQQSPHISFCAFDGETSRFVHIGHDKVVATIASLRTGDDRPSAGGSVAANRQERAVERTVTFLNRHLHQLPRTRRQLLLAAGHARRVVLELARIPSSIAADRRAIRRVARRAVQCLSSTWGPETTFCSLGPNFVTRDLEYLAFRRDQVGFRSALILYDLIPLIRPHYFQAESRRLADLKKYFELTIRSADVLFVISETTRRDALELARSAGTRVPAIHTLPLGSSLVDLQATVPQQTSAASIRGGADFILCVGTIEIRKYHALLLDVWEWMLEERGEARTPRLVVVGRPGWSSRDTLARLRHTPSFQDSVIVIEDATDEELVWLYRHSLFTVYPSLYEGWGLPVSESLDFGKLCVTSDSASLPEAGEGLTITLNPFDRATWRDTVARLVDDPTYLATFESTITRSHRHVSASDTAAALLAAVGH